MAVHKSQPFAPSRCHSRASDTRGLDGLVDLREPLVVALVGARRRVRVQETPRRLDSRDVLGEPVLDVSSGEALHGLSQGRKGVVVTVDLVKPR